MPSFGKQSLANLQEAHPHLERLFLEVVKHWDCQVVDGARTLAEQEKNVAKGVSKTMASKHLIQPDGNAWAVDVVPYPVDWTDTKRMYAFGGFVLGIASQLGIRVRWGGDWNGNRDLRDQTFIDLPHFELVDD